MAIPHGNQATPGFSGYVPMYGIRTDIRDWEKPVIWEVPSLYRFGTMAPSFRTMTATLPGSGYIKLYNGVSTTTTLGRPTSSMGAAQKYHTLSPNGAHPVNVERGNTPRGRATIPRAGFEGSTSLLRGRTLEASSDQAYLPRATRSSYRELPYLQPFPLPSRPGSVL